MLKYRYNFSGDFYRKKLVDGKLYDDTDYYNFQIECLIPIDYDTKEEAMGCPASLRFEVEDGHVVLRVYSNWKQGLDENNKWYEHIDGSVIDTIHWEEYWKYKVSRSKKVAKDMGLFVDACADFIPDATLWDELFDIENQPEGWVNTVESLAYSIHVIEVD